MSVRGNLEKRLDAQVSMYVKKLTFDKYGGCAFCGADITDCFHFAGRAKRGTRWNLAFLVGSCNKCNTDFEDDKKPFLAWFIKEHGQKLYDELVLLSNTPAQYTLYDLRDMIKAFTALNKEESGDIITYGRKYEGNGN